MGSDSSIVKMAIAASLPQVPAVVNGLKERGADEKEEEEEEEEEEGEPEEDSWSVKEECEEHILEWRVGVWEAGRNEEKESNVSYKV